MITYRHHNQQQRYFGIRHRNLLINDAFQNLGTQEPNALLYTSCITSLLEHCPHTVDDSSSSINQKNVIEDLCNILKYRHHNQQQRYFGIRHRNLLINMPRNLILVQSGLRNLNTNAHNSTGAYPPESCIFGEGLNLAAFLSEFKLK
ncbi:hypothetical protein KSF78_0003086 [Schistosoma japonicum]|nr:hypothetical protein KSF78_0003086 [Schistosoma japonicum]